MTSRRATPPPIPYRPSHRRDWRTFWRRCICGLRAPCIDRLVPAEPLPFPRLPAATAVGRAPSHGRVRTPGHRPAAVADGRAAVADGRAAVADGRAAAPTGRAVSRASPWHGGGPADPLAATPTATTTPPRDRAAAPTGLRRPAPPPAGRGHAGRAQAQIGRAGSLTPAQTHRADRVPPPAPTALTTEPANREHRHGTSWDAAPRGPPTDRHAVAEGGATACDGREPSPADATRGASYRPVDGRSQ
jgi:hypothetical protein